MTISFEKLSLSQNLINGLKKERISKPTGIQSRAIPVSLDKKDIIAQSETGSGKTLAYLLPIFEKLDTTKKETQCIILVPTHELAIQINNQIKTLSSNSQMSVTSTAIIGTANIKRQIESLKEKPHIIVGSTGRILELIKNRKIGAHNVRTLVLDEGDRLLDEKNVDGVRNVIKTMQKKQLQIMLFSATVNEHAVNMAKSLMKDPEILIVKEKTIVNPDIDHIYITCDQRDKIVILRKLVASIKPKRAIVFINKSEEIEITTLKLRYHHLKAYGLYGESSKEDRKKAMDMFRSGKIQLLVASDLAARGLDIKDVTHIFNLDLPPTSKEYVHRVGRTARAGKSGTAVSIITKKDIPIIKRYERDLNIKLNHKIISKGKLLDTSY
ncbi:DEAD-box ATP-dependent RNA helicase CshA [Gottschalkia acidurici 9a]|uniref:DEAD-box ATP-dependent RNA helicase CshA n=1 Tax=Gottschalkia acidurici (strain ATCC 7906 / DSM 604 / BCRC 14475 / CIP 104303 / KCTC 5404 / NCIMB 10678 / 9a) TaxID=1128398 RepID=K0AZ51_GOTA9|nr:DEAD/DEAH box helicase [Gottschalkia acidurici]AFS78544.1 DEAD-box ATP-dependent RNA helicase CshA [Gottschalkia acidurici 9a]